jgi:hypothetical protein
MNADPAAAPATTGLDLWAACEERAVVRFTLADCRTLTGHYTSRVGLHFLHRTGRDLPLIGEVSGPYQPGDVIAVEVVRTRAQVLEDAYVRLHGERVPGREPRTRDEHEERLQVLAVAAASDDWQRQMQLHRHFREAADRIGLTQGKRTWLLNAAAWARRSNAPPTMADLWVDAVASPSCRARPCPQDFGPDPQVRRRTALPPHIRADPWSIPNILHALRAASLKARATRLGDPPHDAGHIQIEMPIKGRSRFVAIAQRDERGRMAWRWVWDGNQSKAGLARHRRALRCDAYARMVEVLRHGRRGVQADLFCRSD